MRYSMGIDPSLTGTGVMVLDEFGNIIHSSVIKSESTTMDVKSRMDRFENIVKRVKLISETWPTEIVCIEGYSFMSLGGKQNDRIEFGGLLRYVLSRSKQVIEVSPMSLKKWASGSGKGDKTGCVAELTMRYGVRFGSSDEYDAYALARIGCQLKQFEQPATASQREVIETLLFGKPVKPKKKKKANDDSPILWKSLENSEVQDPSQL